MQYFCMILFQLHLLLILIKFTLKDKSHNFYYFFKKLKKNIMKHYGKILINIYKYICRIIKIKGMDSHFLIHDNIYRNFLVKIFEFLNHLIGTEEMGSNYSIKSNNFAICFLKLSILSQNYILIEQHLINIKQINKTCKFFKKIKDFKYSKSNCQKYKNYFMRLLLLTVMLNLLFRNTLSNLFQQMKENLILEFECQLTKIQIRTDLGQIQFYQQLFQKRRLYQNVQ